MQASQWIALMLAGVLFAILFVWGASLSRRRPSWLAALSLLATLCVVGGVAAGLRIGPARAAQAARDAEVQQLFVRDMSPVVEELKRLEFQPPGTRDYYDQASYRSVGGGNGSVAVRNHGGEMIWVDFQIDASYVRVGCEVEGDFLEASPYGAALLRATGGCRK